MGSNYVRGWEHLEVVVTDSSAPVIMHAATTLNAFQLAHPHITFNIKGISKVVYMSYVQHEFVT